MEIEPKVEEIIKTPTHLARLARWADFLDRLDPQFFEIDGYQFFTKLDDRQKENIEKIYMLVAENPSQFEPFGLKCCAVGWLPAIFPDRFKVGEGGYFGGLEFFDCKGRSFLGLNTIEYCEIVMKNQYKIKNPTPKDVADRIRKIAKR